MLRRRRHTCIRGVRPHVICADHSARTCRRRAGDGLSQDGEHALEVLLLAQLQHALRNLCHEEDGSLLRQRLATESVQISRCEAAVRSSGPEAALPALKGGAGRLASTASPPAPPEGPAPPLAAPAPPEGPAPPDCALTLSTSSLSISSRSPMGEPPNLAQACGPETCGAVGVKLYLFDFTAKKWFCGQAS